MKRLSLGLALCLAAGSLQANEVLFEMGGKGHTSKDLSPALQQAVYDIQEQAYANLQKVVDAQIIEEYAETEAKKKGISVDEFEKKAFKGKTVGDKEAKKWFEDNKARLGGRDFDTLKKDIIGLLQNQEDDKVRTNLITKIKNEKKFKFVMQEPQAPVFEIKTAGFPSKGNPNAKVTIVEFADYKCPHCAHASEALKKVLDNSKYKDKVNFVYLDFPIDQSGVSKRVAEGAYCADQQKKYWDYHYLAFSEKSLSANSPIEFAKKLKLDEKAFEKCLGSKEATQRVENGRIEGDRIGIRATPSIFVNGRKLYGNSQESIEEALKKIL